MMLMKLHRRSIGFLGETLVHAPLPGSLEGVLLPKPGVAGKTAILAVRYGSLDLRFELDGRTNETPPGVAHFLEHQLFKKHGGDALMEFSKYGASSNAFTDYTMTAYHFSCTDQFEEALGELVRLVFRPEFRDDWVEREKSIIEKELRMYLDMPEMRAYQNLVRSLYRGHPVRIDIGGTIESIRRITRSDLELCYRAFYRPANMMLVLAGDLDPRSTFRTVCRLLNAAGVPGKGNGRARTLFPEEPPGAARSKTQIRMTVSRPRVIIGYKDLPKETSPEETARRDLVSSILVDLLFGRASAFFAREYEKGLIDDEFSAGYTSSTTFGFTAISAETSDPEAFLQAVQGELAAARRRPIPRSALERVKRKVAGRFIRAFDSVESAAFTVLETLHRRVTLERLVEMILSVRPSELHDRMQAQFSAENRSVSLVLPKPGAAPPPETASKLRSANPGVHPPGKNHTRG